MPSADTYIKLWQPLVVIVLASILCVKPCRAAECGQTKATDAGFDANDFPNHYSSWWNIRDSFCGGITNPSLCDHTVGNVCSDGVNIGPVMLTVTQEALADDADLSQCYDATEIMINECVIGLGIVDGSYTAGDARWTFAVAPVPFTPGDDGPSVTPNPGGTNFHVSGGCISFNSNNSRCDGQPPYNVANIQNRNKNTAYIYAMFDGSTSNKYVTPGCKFQAVVPSNFGDVFFGDDNCLYDSNKNMIDNQCCQNKTVDTVLNPYYVPQESCRSSSQFPLVLDNVQTVKDNANKLCQALKKNNVKLNQQSNQLPDSVRGQTQAKRVLKGGHSIVYSLVWTPDACLDPGNPADLDFSSYDQQKCVNNFVAQNGQQCSNGGQLSIDCALWSVDAHDL